MPTLLEPKTVALLGVPFHDVTMDETLAVIDDIVRERTPRFIATANLDFAAQAEDDVELQRILLDAHLVLCDGKPLLWASRWLDAPLRDRVTGSDLTPLLAAHAARRGYRLFFLGSDPEVLSKAKTELEARHPGLQICGTYAPPYARLHDLNNEEIAALVQAARPDILLVALGAPKQEKWIYMHYRKLGVPCSIGIGASLDFVAGKFTRAPVWMQRTGLEWAYRLSQEPRRLLGRYSRDFLFFLRAFRRQKQATRSLPPRVESETLECVSHPPGTVVYAWAGRIDAAGIAAGEVVEPFPQAGQSYVWLNAAEVTFVDSTGLGLLLKAFHKAKEAGGGLVVLAPAPSLRQMLISMKLDRLIPMAEDEKQARAFFKTERAPEPAKADYQGGDQRLVCRWTGDLDLSRSKDFATYVREQWLKTEAARLLQVDLSEVRFMDSSGLGSLLQTRKLVGTRPQARLELVGLNDNLRNVIRLARLEQLLGVVA